jgi:hypothetical protein
MNDNVLKAPAVPNWRWSLSDFMKKNM